MAQAEVGALRVRLGADAGELNTALGKAEGSLAKFAAKLGFTAGAAAAAGAKIANAVIGAVEGIITAIPQAINTMDELSKTAQKMGVTTQALSELAHAADLSNVSVEQLTKASGILAKNMQAIAAGDTTGAAARAFEALGISIRGSDGSLKSFDQVLSEVADKFAGYEDGANKTALAMNLFGKSGAQLIPLLNEGSRGLATMREEARQLGITIDEKTGKSAEIYNDNLTRLHALHRGFVVRLTTEMLPTLETLSTRFIENAKAANLIEGAAVVVSSAFKGFAAVVIGVVTQIQNAGTAIYGLIASVDALTHLDFTASSKALSDMMDTIQNRTAEAERSIMRLWGTLQNTPAEAARAAAGLQGFQPPEMSKPDAPDLENLAARNELEQKRNEIKAEQNRLEAEGKRLAEDLRDPMEQLAAAELKLAELRRVGALSAVQGAELMQRATFSTAGAYAGMASQIAGNLQGLFAESKGFAIAQAVINTAEAVTKTLATYGATPWGFALAASAAAAGAAQIAAIRSAKKNGSGGGGGGSSFASTATAAPTQAPQLVTINLQGQSLFSRETVISLMQQMSGLARDGVEFQVNP